MESLGFWARLRSGFDALALACEYDPILELESRVRALERRAIANDSVPSATEMKSKGA